MLATDIGAYAETNSGTTRSMLQQELDRRVNYYGNDINSSNQFKLSPNMKFADLGAQFRNVLNRMGNDTKRAANAGWDNLKDGGLGNIYGQGVGINGAVESVNMELNKQFNSLSNKIMGNINDATTKISKSVTTAVTNPVNGAIGSIGRMAGNATDSATSLIAKPVEGTTKMIENITTNASRAGYSYINDAGEYVADWADDLGNVAYNKQVVVSNNIGKNRLKSKLGNVN